MEYSCQSEHTQAYVCMVGNSRGGGFSRHLQLFYGGPDIGVPPIIGAYLHLPTP